MNILFIVPYTPNPIRVRPYELLRTLAKRGHRITLATLYESAQEQADLHSLDMLGIEVIAHPLPKHRSVWNSALALPTRLPLQANYCWQPSLARELQQLVHSRTFDLVHVEHLRGARYGLFLRNLLANGPQLGNNRRPSVPIIWDSVDCISHLFAQAAERSRSLSGRLMTTFELPRTQRYEGWLLRQFSRVLVTSAVDQQALIQLANNCRSPSCNGAITHPVVIPNGVDLRQGNETTSSIHKPLVQANNSNVPFPIPTIVFSGKMSYHANVSAAIHLVQDIMPQVWAKHPEVKVQIVGKILLHKFEHCKLRRQPPIVR